MKFNVRHPEIRAHSAKIYKMNRTFSNIHEMQQILIKIDRKAIVNQWHAMRSDANRCIQASNHPNIECRAAKEGVYKLQVVVANHNTGLAHGLLSGQPAGMKAPLVAF